MCATFVEVLSAVAAGNFHVRAIPMAETSQIDLPKINEIHAFSEGRKLYKC